MANIFNDTNEMASKIASFIKVNIDRDFSHTHNFIFNKVNGTGETLFTISFKGMANKNDNIEVSIKSADNDTTRPLAFLNVSRNELRNHYEEAKTKIIQSISNMPSYDSQSHLEPAYQRLDISKNRIVSAITDMINESNKSVNYFNDHKNLPSVIENENTLPLKAFFRSVLTLKATEKLFYDNGISNALLLKNGIKPLDGLKKNEFNYIKTAREGILDFVLDKKSAEYVEIMTVLSNKVSKELFTTVRFREKKEEVNLVEPCELYASNKKVFPLIKKPKM